MKEQIDSLPEYYRENPDILIREFSSYLIERVSAYREIDTFIVLIDEIMTLENALFKKFPGESEKDLTSILRSSLLDQ